MPIIKILSWCLFDFATTIFMMNIVTLSFAQWLDQSFGNGDTYYGIISAIVYIFCLFLYPLTGPICDRGHKVFPLFILTVISISGVFSLGFCGKNLILAGILFTIAYLPYQLALTFYNALLEDISTSKQMGTVSGLGIALRYVGAIFGLFTIGFFIRNNYQITLPSWLGGVILQLPEFLKCLIIQDVLPGKVLYVNAFVPTAILYTIFVLPLFLFIRPSKYTQNIRESNSFSLPEIIKNLLTAIKDKNTFWLLAAILLSGIPVYASVHFMSIFLEKIGGFAKSELPLFLMFSTIFAVLGGIGFGLLLRPLGNKLTFGIIIMIWTATLLIGSICSSKPIMWAIGIICGIGMGGYWATSRVLVLDITPPGYKGVYLSLYWIVIVICGILGTGLWPFFVYIATKIGFPETPQRLSVFLLGLLGLLAFFAFSNVKFNKKIL